MNERIWLNLLLCKFPRFDPAWSQDIKDLWWEAFKDLFERGNHAELTEAWLRVLILRQTWVQRTIHYVNLFARPAPRANVEMRQRYAD